MAAEKKKKPSNVKQPSNPNIQLIPSDGGRPKKTLTETGWKLVKTLSGFMATDEEIAEALSDDSEKITVDTLTNEMNRTAFSENKKSGQCYGKSSLRAWQFQSAKKGNVSMQIFLGKNYLGQSDRQEIEQSESKDIVINVMGATKEIANNE